MRSSLHLNFVDQHKRSIYNFSQFRFPHYKTGNIPLHLELLYCIQLQKILEEDKPTIEKNNLFTVEKKRKYYGKIFKKQEEKT